MAEEVVRSRANKNYPVAIFRPTIGKGHDCDDGWGRSLFYCCNCHFVPSGTNRAKHCKNLVYLIIHLPFFTSDFVPPPPVPRMDREPQRAERRGGSCRQGSAARVLQKAWRQSWPAARWHRHRHAAGSGLGDCGWQVSIQDDSSEQLLLSAIYYDFKGSVK